jgi:hypothetical protein
MSTEPLLFLATVPAEHIAAKLAVPIGIVVFCGSVYLLLWSNYGAKKGALIYGTALGAFCAMLGIFWWFGAPGTPVATGLQNFPGQAPDAYLAHWYPFEPQSERAQFFSATDGIALDDDLDGVGELRPVAEHLGLEDLTLEERQDNPKYAFTVGDVTQAGDLMLDLFMRTENGLGGERRAAYIEAAEAGLADQVSDPDDYRRADPFFTGVIRDDEVRLGRVDGIPVSGIQAQAVATYVNDDGDRVEVVVDERPVFAFKQESNAWFPSAVWTGISLLIFLLSLFGLDRLEQREKKALAEVQEPERLAVPIRQ